MYQDILPKTGLLSKCNRETVALAFVAALFVLVAVGAFGLGRLSGVSEAHAVAGIYTSNAPLINTTPGAETNLIRATPVSAPGAKSATAVASSSGPGAKNFVASKNGAKYYGAGCSGASRIKAANQVWFASASDAEAAGYTLASGCNP